MGTQRLLAVSEAFVASSSNVILNLPTDHVIRKTGIRLRGTYTIATADSTATPEGAALRLINNITLKIDGKFQVVAGVSFEDLVRMSEKFEGSSGQIANITAVTAATYPIDLIGWIHHEVPGVRQTPHMSRAMTGLDLRGRQSAVITLDMAALSAASTPAGTTVLSEALTVDVIHIVDTQPREVPAGRQIRVLESIQHNIAASGVQDIDLEDGNFLRSVFMVARDNSVRDENIIGNVQLRLKRGGTTHTLEDRDWEDVQVDAQQLMGVSFAVGENLVLLDRDNTGEDAEDLSNTSETKLRLTAGSPTATSNVRVVAERITPQGALPRSGL